MKITYCHYCKCNTAHFKDLCIKCGKKQITNPFEKLFGEKK